MGELNPQQYQKVKQLFWELKDIPKDQWVSHLNYSCSKGDNGNDSNDSDEANLIINEVLALLNGEHQLGILDRGNAIDLLQLNQNPIALEQTMDTSQNQINLFIGRVFNNRYHITKLLGEGGMGTVFLAKDTNINNKDVAVKILLQNISDKAIKRFDKERKSLARLNHPNIVVISDSGFTEDNYHFFVMEYLEGFTLKDFLTTNLSDLALERKLKIIFQICDGLSAIHSQAIIHRDLKPNNIMIFSTANQDYIKIFDFSIAKNVSDDKTKLTTQGTIGTYRYMSPEQLHYEERPVDIASDIYSLGIIFYELLSTQHPLATKAEINIADARWISKHLLQPPTPISTLCPELPKDLSDLVMQMLAKEATDRPSLQSISNTIKQYITPANAPINVSVNGSPTNNASTHSTVDMLIAEQTTVKIDTFNFETVKVDIKGKIIQRLNKQAKQFIEDLGNSVLLEMVEIPGGIFMMGTSPGDFEKVLTEYKRYDRSQRDAFEWVSTEIPQHQVTVPTFYIGKYQVTQVQWKAIMGKNPSYFKGDENLPVEQVSWNDAVEFCKKLSEKTNKNYRLPSEAEWEYACRAGSTTAFAFGETITPDIVNYAGGYPYGEAPKGKYRKKTILVGILRMANNFGLYDMHGNVWEWCQDQWHDNYNGAPIDGSPWENQTSKYTSHILRGGAYYSYANYCRSANRYRYLENNGANNYGFRVVAKNDPSQKFALREQIKECDQEINRLSTQPQYPKTNQNPIQIQNPIPNNQLSGNELEQLQYALVNAFDLHSIKKMITFKLDRDITSITTSSGLENIIFDLITTANKQGWIIQLISCAREYNPGNELLKSISDSLLNKR